ncbi:MAG: hypothetical protein JO257_06245 [Deltaproteobacteria bacterium]|nr:hypothetical protein [Deltaproteobacteria bacterium]
MPAKVSERNIDPDGRDYPTTDAGKALFFRALMTNPEEFEDHKNFNWDTYALTQPDPAEAAHIAASLSPPSIWGVIRIESAIGIKTYVAGKGLNIASPWAASAVGTAFSAATLLHGIQEGDAWEIGGSIAIGGVAVLGLNARFGTLSDYDTRAWYNERIREINTDVEPTEANARSVVQQRNMLKAQARLLMADRAEARKLDVNRPIHDFDYYAAKYRAKGLDGAALWREVIKAGSRANAEVNAKFGLE